MPYNPGVTPIGGQLIAQGINSAADSMAAGMKLYRENQLRNAALQKQNEQLAAAFMNNKDLAPYAPGGAEEIQKFLDKSIKGGGLTLKDNLALNASLNSAFLTAQHVSDLNKAKLEQQRAQQEIDVTNKAAERSKLDDSAFSTAIGKFMPQDASQKAPNFDINQFLGDYTKNGGSAAGLAKFSPVINNLVTRQSQEEISNAKIAAMQAIAEAKNETAQAKADAAAARVPQGYRWKDPSMTAMEPIPGSEAAMKVEEKQKADAEAQTKDAATKDQVLSGIDITVNNLTKAIRLIEENPGRTTGFGSMLKVVPGTDANKLRNYIDTIKSNIAIDTLQQMRAASKTGASGFGQLSEKELNVIENKLGALPQSSDDKELVKNMKDIKNLFLTNAVKIKTQGTTPTKSGRFEIIAHD